jgi:hypothetical protein
LTPQEILGNTTLEIAQLLKEEKFDTDVFAKHMRAICKTTPCLFEFVFILLFSRSILFQNKR